MTMDTTCIQDIGYVMMRCLEIFKSSSKFCNFFTNWVVVLHVVLYESKEFDKLIQVETCQCFWKEELFF